jgi:hypothetical protein
MVCYALQKVHFCRKLLPSQELLCFSASVEVKLPKLDVAGSNPVARFSGHAKISGKT